MLILARLNGITPSDAEPVLVPKLAEILMDADVTPVAVARPVASTVAFEASAELQLEKAVTLKVEKSL